MSNKYSVNIIGLLPNYVMRQNCYTLNNNVIQTSLSERPNHYDTFFCIWERILSYNYTKHYRLMKWGDGAFVYLVDMGI